MLAESNLLAITYPPASASSEQPASEPLTPCAHVALTPSGHTELSALQQLQQSAPQAGVPGFHAGTAGVNGSHVNAIQVTSQVNSQVNAIQVNGSHVSRSHVAGSQVSGSQVVGSQAHLAFGTGVQSFGGVGAVQGAAASSAACCVRMLCSREFLVAESAHMAPFTKSRTLTAVRSCT